MRTTYQYYIVNSKLINLYIVVYFYIFCKCYMEYLQFLQKMLDRPRIYGTEYWYNLLEERARENMKKAIKLLPGQDHA